MLKQILSKSRFLLQKSYAKYSLSCGRFSSTNLNIQNDRNQLQTGGNHNETNSLKIFDKINELVKSSNEGRLFAVVHLCGKQFKISTGDVITIEGYWPPNVGDKLKLEKVLCVGGKSFSLFGKPLVQPELVNVEATVIEKTLSHTRTHFKKKRRKQYMRINFYRCEQTFLRITDVAVKGQINKPPEVSGLNRIFY